MAISKLIFNGVTQMDVSDTTATASDVAPGTYFYASNGVKTAGTSTAVSIPTGMAYFNGYLLPQLPTFETGYDYYWIRKNDQTGTYDLVCGNGRWYTRSGTATLDNWALLFANLQTDGSRQYSISQDGTATDWGEPTTSYSTHYGTANDRKVIFSNHNLTISSINGNVLYERGYAIYPS